MTTTRRRLLLVVCPSLMCGPMTPLDDADTRATALPSTTAMPATTSGMPADTAALTAPSSEMGDATDMGDDTTVGEAMHPDLPPEPPADDGLYHGDAPGCGDGVPEAGVYCFESIMLADRIQIPGLADYDGDGHLDAVWLKYDGTLLQRGDGQGNLGPEAYLFEEIDETYWYDRLLPVDIDQDGDIDVIHDDFNELRVLLNDGQANFAAGPTIAADTWFAFATVSDLDLDGKLELVAAEDNNGTNVLSIFKFTGDGVTRIDSTVIPGCEVNGLAIARLDPDALPDMVAVGRQCDRMPNVPTPLISLVNAGALSFTAFGAFPASMSVAQLVAGDYDADGRIDVAAAAADTGDIRILLGLGDGGFAPQLAAGPAQPLTVSPSEMFAAELDGVPGDELAYMVYRNLENFDSEVTLAVLMDPGTPADLPFPQPDEPDPDGSVSWPASRVLELAPAFWQQTLQHQDTQQRLAANVFRGVSVLDHAQPPLRGWWRLNPASRGDGSRHSRSRRYAQGSMPWSWQLARRETKIVLTRAPSSLPRKSQFFRPRTSRRRFCSEMLLSRGRRPSSRKRQRAARWLRA